MNKDIKNEGVRKDTLERRKQGEGGTVCECQIKQNSRPQSLSWKGWKVKNWELGLSK